MTEYNFHIILYGDEREELSTSHYKAFFDVASQLSTDLGIEYRTIDFILYDQSDGLRDRTYRYINRNKRKIDEILENDALHDIVFTAFNPDSYIIKETICTMGFIREYKGVNDPFLRFFFQIQASQLMDRYKDDELRTYLHTLVTRVDQLIDVKYGLIDTMSQDACGVLYFLGTLPNGVQKSERMNFMCWMKDEQRKYFATKWRDVYWGNIVTVDHLGRRPRRLLNRLRRILGSANVKEFSNNKYLLFLTDGPLADQYLYPSDRTKRNKLRKILATKDLLISCRDHYS